VKWRGSITVPSSFAKLGPLLEQVEGQVRMKFGPCAVGIFNFHKTFPNTMLWTVTVDRCDIPKGTHVWEIMEPYIENKEDEEMVKEMIQLAKESDLHHVLEFSSINPLAEKKGWGGRGRVTLSGDSAHCLRPSSGLGGSMAFEDTIFFLSREIAAGAVKKDVLDGAEIVARFEAARRSRVARIWQHELDTSQYYFRTSKFAPPPTKEYKQWLDAGV